MSEETKKEEGFTPVPNDGGECMTLLGQKVNCPKCGSPPSEHEVRNHSLMWHDGDVHCTKCGAYVRSYDAG
jgi:uncharacterized Zn finger protein (UPF0148 family)